MFSKYNAKPTYVDGKRFASKREADRYSQLTQLQRAKIISDLECQPKFPLIVAGHLICTYIGDFRYKENGHSVTEDVKGFKTPEYRLKRKLLLATHPGIDHREIGIKQAHSASKPVSREILEIFGEAARKRA